MSRRSTHRNSPVILAVAGLFACGAPNADTGVYESAADIEIGRVFLTRAERLRLDQLRRLQPAAASDESTASRVAGPSDTDRPRRPAGYFYSSTGQRRAWAGDDFVVSGRSRSSTQVFPGDVVIVRHVNSVSDDQVEAVDAETAAPEQEQSAPGASLDDDVDDGN